jgi:sec-independent protein translocase protein TatA
VPITGPKTSSAGDRGGQDNILEETDVIGDLFDSPWKVLIVAAVLIVLFGSKKLPDATRSLGRSMRILKTEVSSIHEDEPGSAASGTPVPQAQLTAAPAALKSEQADQKVQLDALQQQIRDLQRAAAMDVAPGSAPTEVPQTQPAG